MDKSERKRLKRQGKELVEQRSQDLRAELAAQNPWPIGSPEWVARYIELQELQKEEADRIMEFYRAPEASASGSGGSLADFFISKDCEASRYPDAPEEFGDRAEYKRITPLELSMLWAIMRGVIWEADSLNDFACLLQKDNGSQLIHRIPSAMLTDLTRLDSDQIGAIAPKWAATEELRWPPHAAHEVIVDLVRLAQLALNGGRNVYLWNSV